MSRRFAQYALVFASLFLSASLLAQTATLTPASLSFSNQVINTTSPSQPVTLKNTGAAQLHITNIATSGNFAQTHTCGATLAAGASCTINVTFTPTAPGIRNGVLTVTDSANNSPQTATLTGFGVLPATLTPTSLSFGNQVLNTTSSAQIATLTNHQTGALAISSKTITGDFSQTNNCPASLAGGASCTFSVKFTPTATGVRTGTLTVTDNVINSPQTVSLGGTGVLAVTLTPVSLAFGNQVINTTSAAQVATIQNNQSTTLTISSITVPSGFAQTNNCGTSLNAGASCTINVTFSPTATTAYSGNLTVTDSAVNSPQTASLTGAGINVPVPANFFAMDINQNNANDPWPSTVPTTLGSNFAFGTYRTLGSSIKWADLYQGTTCQNSAYNFTSLNNWINLAQTHGQQVMFTAYYTPSCLSSNPTDSNCAFSPNQNGGCELPSDVTTTDHTWIDFLTQLFQGVPSGSISYLEVWNEPNNGKECNSATGNCNPANLTILTQDALCVLKGIANSRCTPVGGGLAPNIQIISPPVTAVFSQTQPDCTQASGKAQIAGYLGTLLSQGVANYSDIIGYHGYVKIPALLTAGSGQPDPAAGAACENDLIASVRQAIGSTTSKPIYDTEASWGSDSTANNSTYFANKWIRGLTQPSSAQQVQAEEAAFTGIFYLIKASNQPSYGGCTPGVSCNPLAGVSWYGWDFDGPSDPGSTGQFWNQHASTPAFTDAGVAYYIVNSWLQGASPVAPCSVTPSGGVIGVWTCSFVGAGNSAALAVWDTSKSCVGTVSNPCTTSTYTFPAGTYTEWRDLFGNPPTSLNGATSVQIGLVPILLDNGTVP